jgi:hypothetical protein
MQPVHLNDSSTRLTFFLKVSLRDRPIFSATAVVLQGSLHGSES